MKRNKMIIIYLMGILLCLMAVFLPGDKTDLPINSITIIEEDNKLYFKSKVKLDKYVIYINQNKMEIKKNDIDKEKLMITKPKKLTDIVINEEQKGITIKYKISNQNKITNILKVEGYYNNKKIAKSKSIKVKQDSEISNSVIYINNKEFKSLDNQLINYNSLQEGKNKITIKNYDKYGNETDNTIDYKYKKINIKQENNQVKYDYEKGYKYYLVNNETNRKIELNNENIDLNNIFNNIFNNTTINSPYNFGSNIENSSANISWECNNTEFNYNYYIEGVKGDEKIYSDINNYSVVNNIKGYYYHFGKEDIYDVSTKDDFIENDNFVYKLSEYGQYYFYIRAVDSNGNLSKQEQINIKYPSPIPIDDKMSLIQSFVSRDSTVTDSKYYKVLNTIYNYIPNNVINLLKNNNIKINITDIDLRIILSDLTNETENTHMQGFFLPDSNLLYVGGDYPEAVLHEIGHAVDDYTGWVSCLTAFDSSYSERYNINISEHCSSNNLEYFAEAFFIYFYNPNELKNNAPNTYYYINNIINNI